MFCSLETEDTTNYLLHCQHLSSHGNDLMNSVKLIILYFQCWPVDSRFDENNNKIILEATISYLNNSERFSMSLFE